MCCPMKGCEALTSRLSRGGSVASAVVFRKVDTTPGRERGLLYGLEQQAAQQAERLTS